MQISTEVPATGLTKEARRRLAEFGANVVADETPAAWRIFLAKFSGPIPWMLGAAVVLQFGRGAPIEAAAIGGLLLFNATLGIIPGRPRRRGACGTQEAARADRVRPP
ncbi:cation-transporting P-type ATPase [Mesorhizobium sp.]|uniref:cation-transporting P-type ATPase n=1 Tax=Mesorhizobium sp. TaxID=1871066 RepID=UPI0025BF7E09|nr:cation-transporting P-type ATPase [Mesorhizobium sp.]